MPRAAALLLTVLAVLPARAAVAPPREQWLAVVAPAYLDAVEPLCQARRRQGMRVVVVPAIGAQARVHALCRDWPGASYVLLVGAVASPHADRVVGPLRGSMGRMTGEPTDAGYGCPKGGRLPAVAVGRFPARDAGEVGSMVSKTLAFEQAQALPGAWKHRLTVLAGIPAYNPVVDRLVEGIALSRLGRLHPRWTGRAVYTNPGSPFCLPEHLLRARSLAYLRDGQAFTLYLGHSNAEGLYGGPGADFLDRGDWGQAVLPHGGGVFITYGCNGCQLAGRDGEGYGVAAMRNPHGPAAVLGSHGICFASMVQLAADGLFRAAFQGPLPGRLGEAWLAQLDGVARGKIDFLGYRLLDAVDGDPRIPQAIQRQEHLEMFVLLGDPALRLPQWPGGITLDAPHSVRAGQALHLRGRLPAGLESARVEVRLERRVGTRLAGLLPVPRQPGADRDRALLANHERANQFGLAAVTIAARDGRFEATLDVPADAPGRVVLRVRAFTQSDEALAVREIEVQPKRPGEGGS
jgi:hypothetical protein